MLLIRTRNQAPKFEMAAARGAEAKKKLAKRSQKSSKCWFVFTIPGVLFIKNSRVLNDNAPSHRSTLTTDYLTKNRIVTIQGAIIKLQMETIVLIICLSTNMSCFGNRERIKVKHFHKFVNSEGLQREQCWSLNVVNSVQIFLHITTVK